MVENIEQRMKTLAIPSIERSDTIPFSCLDIVSIAIHDIRSELESKQIASLGLRDGFCLLFL